MRLAKNLVSSGFVDVIELSSDISLIDLDVKEEWEGKSLTELNLRKKYGINIIAIRTNDGLETRIDPNMVLEKDTQLVVIVNSSKLKKLK